MSFTRKASFRPVFDFLSFFVCALLGNGSSFGVGAAWAEAGRSRASARGRSRFTGANLHGVRSRVHALLRFALRLRAGHRRAPRALAAGAPRALPRMAGGRAARDGRGGGRPAARGADRVPGAVGLGGGGVRGGRPVRGERPRDRAARGAVGGRGLGPALRVALEAVV